MQQKIKTDQLFQAMQNRVLIDVRTPAEFAKGHIPGAVNLPLFTNEERVEVGTTYKQANPEKALLLGLDLVGGKMSGFVKKAQAIAPHRQLIVHCWRGGKRSESMGWLLNLAGFNVQILEGGYKAYRNFVLDSLDQLSLQLMILGGYTGSGKTEILSELAKQGEVVLDLEALAHHKGSSFGALGEAPQPSVEQFENDLLATLAKLPKNSVIWVENESRSIGRIYLPAGFWKIFHASPLIHLEIPLEDRVERLVKEYGRFPKEALRDAFIRIKKRLGGQHLQAALAALEVDDLATAAAIALRYYDKAYDLTLKKKQESLIQRIKVPDAGVKQIAEQLLKIVHHEL